MRRFSPLNTVSLFTLVTFLSACGGGGGSGGSDSGADVNSAATDGFVELGGDVSSRVPFMGLPDLAEIELDADNAEVVVATALQAFARAMQLGNEEGVVDPFAEFLAGSGDVDFGFSQFTGAQLDEFLQWDAQGLADGSTEVDCTVSGQIVLDVNVPDDAEPDFAGVGLELRSCDLGNDLLLTGGLDIELSGTLEALDAGFEAFDNATLSVVANDLAIHRFPNGFSANGELTVDVQTIVGGTSLMVAMNFDYAGVDEAIGWQDFQIEATKDDATGAFSVRADGLLNVNQPDLVNGRFEIETKSAIVGVAGNTPEAGEIWIYGQGDSRIAVNFLSGGDVTIQVFDGEEARPLDIASSWSELRALLAP